MDTRMETEMEACARQAVVTDINGEGLVSCFDRERQRLWVSAEFYAAEKEARCYHSREEIDDPITRLQWDLYMTYPEIDCMAVVRGFYTLLWATLGRAIPPLNAFHAEHFYGEIPCTERDPMPFSDFEAWQLDLIRNTVGHKDLSQVGAVLLRSFGALVVAREPEQLSRRIRLLEQVAHLSWEVMLKEPRFPYLDYTLLNEYHYMRNGGECWMQELPEKEDGPEEAATE